MALLALHRDKIQLAINKNCCDKGDTLQIIIILINGLVEWFKILGSDVLA